MKQKVIRHGFCAVFALLLCLQMVLPLGTYDTAVTVEAATKKVAFASSVKSSVKEAALEAGATSKTKIGVANVKNYTNVYSKRSSTSTLKGRLYRGCGAYVLKTKGKWSYISSGSLTGWVKSRYIVTGSSAKTLVQDINPRVATVTASELNVRKSKSSSSDILAKVNKGTQLIVLGASSKWLKVRLTSSTVGYIYRSYTKMETGLYPGSTREEEEDMEILMDETCEKADTEVSKVTSDSSSGKWVSLGTFRVTAYCACSKCNGSSNAGKTASGVEPTTNHTIAVDRSVIPLGSKIRLGSSDTVYVAEDTGVTGNKIDVFYGSHSSALDFGVKKLEVFIYQD